MLRQRVVACLLAALLPLRSLGNDNNQAYNNNNAANKDDDVDYVEQHLYDSMQQVDDNIEYWTSFHIRAKRCVNYKEKDVIVFDIFMDQCMDLLVGTYWTPVPHYMEGYLAEVAQKMEDRGMDDYVEPEVAQYQYCTPKEVNGEMLYLQLGCADDTTQSIAVNIYKDNTCETKYEMDGMDDARIDISEIQLKFKKCQSCVNWVNKDEDQIDDQFYEKRQMLAPLCSTAWNYKSTCGAKCQRVGLKEEREHWKKPQITLLVVLMSFGAVIATLIRRKRQKMAAKDSLLEQAAMNAAGLQLVHVIGIGVLVVLVITVLAFLGLQNVTLTLILGVNFLLCAYLMKLTYDSADEPQIGPDGQIIEKPDSEDSEDDAESSARQPNNGTYQLPTIT